MITYLIAAGGVFGFLLTRYVAAQTREGSLWRAVLRNLNRFFLPFAIAGIIFSGLQIWLSLTDDLEGASRTIRELETELARLRTVATFLKPSPALEFSIYLALIFLFVAPFWASHRTVISVFSGYLRSVSFAYVWLTLLTSLTFFGGIVAGPDGLLAQRIATIEHHIERIDERYAKALLETKAVLLAELMPRLVKTYETKKKDDDDQQWPHIVLLADKLRKALGNLPGQYPSLLDGPHGPPNGPTPSPVRPPGPPPASASVALSSLNVDEPPIVRPLPPLEKLQEKPASQPLSERRVAPAKSDAPTATPLALQSVAYAYRGRIQPFDQALRLKPTSVAVTFPDVQATRPQWSLETAEAIEKELKASSAEKRTVPEELLASTGARAIGAAYEGSVDAVMDVLKNNEDLGLPLGFLAGFVEAFLNESVKTAIERAIEKQSARLATGASKLAAAVSGFTDDVAAAVAKGFGSKLRARTEAVVAKIDAMEKSIADAQSKIPNDMQALSIQQFEPRWGGLAAVWGQATGRLPDELRKPAAEVLGEIREAIEKLGPVDRMTLLYNCEQVWLDSTETTRLSYISAMLRCEELAGRTTASFQQSLRKALPGLLAGEIADKGLLDMVPSMVGDTKIKDKDLNELVAALQNARSDALGTPGAAARFIAESRKASPSRARSGFMAAMGATSCNIRGELVTEHYVNNVRVSVTRTPITLPCFR
ncbi:hypothetical protein I6F33_34520 [Bradyrhizobium sp. BRP20]|uniref:hypothetical protein n=1 Tax=unclassified Bradyrhizobium TaxID=2631580 RepID=UPI001CD20603|nr:MULTISPECIES: hypothetical protein [unclassified Bradyrhizobium]MCA1438031.1 hypothetical protein [Bradyrhizobium sp. BRP20]MCA1552093.1 hypothetical protein [Bradyrhizobium sp. BRP19]